MPQILDDTNHPVHFESPLGSSLVVQSMSGDEALGRLFSFNLELLSHDFELHFDQIVGQKVTVSMDLTEGERHFNGYIAEFRYLGQTDRYARYQATLRPWLWFLTRTSDCRIFQEKKVPDIIKEVFRENGMSDFEDRLSGVYREWEYCVQYRETDFNFVSRLMEQEGIYYYFEHYKDKHFLVLADDVSTHKPFPGFETVPYFPPSGEMSVQERDHLQYWAVTQSIQPEQYAIQDFDFKKPRVDLLFRSDQPGDHAYPIKDPEIFDYPGEYVDSGDGRNYVKIRLQELRSQFETVNAGGPCRGMSAGCLFTLEDYPRDDQNKEYLVLSVSHQICDTGYISSGGGTAEELYRCQIAVMDTEMRYRQARSTPKPIVQGPQTAIVVGPENEEIHTDKFGRVKVQFHWDRYGESDENSSCWIRVSQLWAGEKWGGMHIPHMGQEVIVSFMEGDPDKPVITGCVYNADCMPPYHLPEHKTQSGIKSRSSKGGTKDDFNEFRFEDKKDAEEIYLHAEKDLTTVVENHERRTTYNTRNAVVGSEDNHRPSDPIEEVLIHGMRLVDVRGDDSLIVREGTVGRKVEVQNGDYELVVEEADYALKVNSGDAATEVSMGNISMQASAGKITMEAAQAIELKVGGSSIKLDPTGVTIKGPMINIEGMAITNIKGTLVKIN